MAIYQQFDPDPGLNNKPAPLGAQEGAFPRKQISDTFRTTMAAIAELGELVDSVGYASAIEAGIIELATPAEVVAGTDALRAVTPAGLATLTATLVRAGLVELATAAEALTGTDAARALTPAAFAGSMLKANPGYIKLPGGIFLQFGSLLTGATGNGAVAYFAPFSIFAAPVCTAVSTNHCNVVVTNSEPSGFGIRTTDANGVSIGPVNVVWVSLGY